MTDPARYADGMVATLAEETRLKALDDPDATAAFWSDGAPEVAGVKDLFYPGAAGQQQAARLYRGAAGADAPVLLYLHGGGWNGGSIALNEAACRALAAESGWSVLSVSYRLAPAHPYPAGLNDAQAALGWLAENGAALGLDPGRIAIGGASAGANLALACALSRPGATIGMLLVYGVYDRDFSRESYDRYGEGPGLTKVRMTELFAMYAPDAGTDPLVVPLHSDALSALPPACLIAAELDVLADENADMAAALRGAGVDTDYHQEPGVTHGFINRGRLLPAARACLTRGADFLKRLSGDLPT
ncbi:alpha/beta hydrolase [Psychromarinibacter halotolerans]|uniref:Alpha/beta hydrolase n=1 Tax=Psychromarinibacter halotolerans TaxID=1775175 RepID=A0ABV7GPX8_9RHOB|nr:alpha/beta hydrolase [Psychromarinibacter halotolerans]MDF0597283.1 alpha/beta hydrolase [Psychromarinibacter halotolerans]